MGCRPLLGWSFSRPCCPGSGTPPGEAVTGISEGAPPSRCCCWTLSVVWWCGYSSWALRWRWPPRSLRSRSPGPAIGPPAATPSRSGSFASRSCAPRIPTRPRDRRNPRRPALRTRGQPRERRDLRSSASWTTTDDPGQQGVHVEWIIVAGPDFSVALADLDKALSSIEAVVDPDRKRVEVADLEQQVAAPDLWDRP